MGVLAAVVVGMSRFLPVAECAVENRMRLTLSCEDGRGRSPDAP